MLNTRTRQILMASCIAFAPAYAFAQAQQTQPAPSQTQTTTTVQSGQQRQAAGSMKMISAPEAGQMMSSDLRGTDVYGANNERVGDIDDLLLDRQGRLVAAIVGVGGFLGIGQKNVAIPFDALEFVDQASASAARTGTTTTTTERDRMATGAVPPADTDRQRMTAQQAEESARMQNQQTTTRVETQTTRAAPAGVMRPERVVLRGITKADLEAAPEFRKDGRAAGTTTRGTGATTTAPANR